MMLDYVPSGWVTEADPELAGEVVAMKDLPAGFNPRAVGLYGDAGDYGRVLVALQEEGRPLTSVLLIPPADSDIPWQGEDGINGEQIGWSETPAGAFALADEWIGKL